MERLLAMLDTIKRKASRKKFSIEVRIKFLYQPGYGNEYPITVELEPDNLEHFVLRDCNDHVRNEVTAMLYQAAVDSKTLPAKDGGNQH